MKKFNQSSVKPLTHSASGAASLQLEKVGVRAFDFSDPYHLALTMSWPQFFIGLFLSYTFINSCFAWLYFIAPNSVSNMQPGSFADAFFFSIETLATVGYGNMAPISLYSHTVAALEVFVGMLLTATMTGLVFVRFSKPKAKLLFANQAVVTRQSGMPLLMIRIGNGRMNALNDANVRLTTLIGTQAADGQRFRTMVDLPLTRSNMPFFPMTWTLIHELNDESPLAKLRELDQESLKTHEIRLLVSVTAHDPALGDQVYANHAYGAEQIALNQHYADAITANDETHTVADMRKISDLLPDTNM